jgi:hypothetical protein
MQIQSKGFPHGSSIQGDPSRGSPPKIALQGSPKLGQFQGFPYRGSCTCTPPLDPLQVDHSMRSPSGLTHQLGPQNGFPLCGVPCRGSIQVVPSTVPSSLPLLVAPSRMPLQGSPSNGSCLGGPLVEVLQKSSLLKGPLQGFS